MKALHRRVRQEIETLHESIVGWFSGRLADTDEVFERELASRFDAEFVLVPPRGQLLSRQDIVEGLRTGHGKNPDFEISIHNVTVRWRAAGHVLATYEEWQRNARESTPPDNGRIATALFADNGEKLHWLHVHETWLPADVMAAGPGGSW